MRRWYPALGSVELTVETRPAHQSLPPGARPSARVQSWSGELLPAGGILPHVLGHADDLPASLLADAYGDEHASVLHASAPGALVPHVVHEHVWVLVIQRPRAPFVDLGVHALELVAQGLGRHSIAPQQLAGVVTCLVLTPARHMSIRDSSTFPRAACSV